MSASKTFLRFQARCLQEARKTADPALKVLLTEMAQEWRRLAQEAKNVQSKQNGTPPEEQDRGD
jgi:hypothetical protein